ncbi:CidA/LrgA family protein [Bordetella sp. 2513F-2]
MTPLIGFTWLLVLQALGVAVSHLLALPFPGPVVGMVLLLGLLRWPLVRRPVSQAAQWLLSHLSLLFVPVGVGVITHLGALSQYGVRILVVIVVSTLAGMTATLWVLRAGRRSNDDA